MDISLELRWDKIKYLYDEAKRLNTSYLHIEHKDRDTFKMESIVTPLDLKYLEDIGLIDIKVETCGEVATAIQIRSELIEYVEERII